MSVSPARASGMIRDRAHRARAARISGKARRAEGMEARLSTPIARPAGAPCNVGSPTCVADHACVAHDGGATCDPLPKTGEPCDGACATGLYCSSFGDSSRACTPILHAGQTCRGEGDDACAEGLRCEAATKTCKAFTAFGAACATDGECERGLFCDETSKRCVRWKL